MADVLERLKTLEREIEYTPYDSISKYWLRYRLRFLTEDRKAPFIWTAEQLAKVQATKHGSQYIACRVMVSCDGKSPLEEATIVNVGRDGMFSIMYCGSILHMPYSWIDPESLEGGFDGVVQRRST